MGLNAVARLRGVEGPGQSPYRSTQSVCGDTADRLAPHEPAILRAARVLCERSRIAELRRVGRAGLPFAESVCGRCGIANRQWSERLATRVTRDRARQIEVEVVGRRRRLPHRAGRERVKCGVAQTR
jgi:hypothetical protein